MPSAIEDYGLIGDCETAALVSREGSIDWLCLPRFDSPACFAALLGSPENGRWLLAPRARATVTRRYRPHTLVLETKFKTAHGQVTVIDFMPVRETTPRIIRIIRGDRGTVQMRMELVLRFDYGLTVPWVTRNSNGSLLAIAGPHRVTLRTSVPVRGQDLRTVAEFSIKAGQTEYVELEYANSFGRVYRTATPKSWLTKTEKVWRKWCSAGRYRGPYADALERSLITLKALVFGPTGGMVAAPTTSLPERIGGPLNWDYRYCWLRDATFTLLGFLHAGYREEARRWKNWLVHVSAGYPDQLQVLYGVAGERLLQESEVAWLSGFRRSRPVRIGNAARQQLQLDIYGELADSLFQNKTRAGLNLDLQFALLERLQKIWREPDNGIWEIRGKQRHFTHSKVMAWVAFDRTIRQAERFRIKAPLKQWRAVRERIHEQVCRFGFNRDLGSFVQHYGTKEVDASLLLLPLVGFLPPCDPRIVGTVRVIEQQLMRDGFVLRYRTRTKGTLMKLGEGAFLPCSFWLADYYKLAGRHQDAENVLKRLLAIRNDLGLLAEEYDVRSRQMIGNFPQALSHVALVNTIINLYSRRGPVHQRAGDQRKTPAC